MRNKPEVLLGPRKAECIFDSFPDTQPEVERHFFLLPLLTWKFCHGCRNRHYSQTMASKSTTNRRAVNARRGNIPQKNL
jgi:hypothetical protein